MRVNSELTACLVKLNLVLNFVAINGQIFYPDDLRVQRLNEGDLIVYPKGGDADLHSYGRQKSPNSVAAESNEKPHERVTRDSSEKFARRGNGRILYDNDEDGDFSDRGRGNGNGKGKKHHNSGESGESNERIARQDNQREFSDIFGENNGNERSNGKVKGNNGNGNGNGNGKGNKGNGNGNNKGNANFNGNVNGNGNGNKNGKGKGQGKNKDNPGQTKKRRKAEQRYLEYLRRIFPDEDPANIEDDDEDFDGRVLASPGEYPHMTALGFRNNLNEIIYQCGGSLISENFVITAAHCTEVSGLHPVMVRIGDLNLHVEEQRIRPQVRDVKRIINHPQYTHQSYYNDIALLELTEDVDISPYVRPIRLWVQDYIPFPTAWAMGYGATAFAKAYTYRLTDLNMTVVDNAACNEQIPHLEEAPQGIIDSQICAKDYLLNRDTCQGDSGGPLQLNIVGKRKKHRIDYYLIGITSFGLVCRTSYPGVYTRISSYVDWIEDIVW